MTIRLFLVDDHTIVRDGLVSILKAEPGLEVVGDAGDGKEVLYQVKSLHPDLVLMDINLGDVSGLDLTCQVKAAFPVVKVLILTVHQDKEMLQEAIRCGASGYLPKHVQKTELINAIHAVCRNEFYIHSSMVSLLLEHQEQSSMVSNSVHRALTDREVQVLRLLAKGYTNRQIAEQINISERTVEFHRKNILFKVNLTSRADLVQYAMEKGYL